MPCEICELNNLPDLNPKPKKWYRIIKKDDVYYCVWFECLPYTKLRTCKLQVHNAKHALLNYVQQAVKSFKIDLQIHGEVDGHFHFTAQEIK